MLIGCFAIAALGCGEGGPAKVPVSVTVTHKGQPVADTRVNLMPSTGRPSFAVTDANGKATGFTTDTSGDGVPLGSYKVTLVVHRESPGADEVLDASAYSAPNPADLPFPRKYLSDATTDQKVEVTEANQEFTLELTN